MTTKALLSFHLILKAILLACFKSGICGQNQQIFIKGWALMNSSTEKATRKPHMWFQGHSQNFSSVLIAQVWKWKESKCQPCFQEVEERRHEHVSFTYFPLKIIEQIILETIPCIRRRKKTLDIISMSSPKQSYAWPTWQSSVIKSPAWCTKGEKWIMST